MMMHVRTSIAVAVVLLGCSLPADPSHGDPDGEEPGGEGAFDGDGGTAPDDSVGSASAAISGGWVAHRRGVVRIDYPGAALSRGCSGFFIGPNIIATAAHCVNSQGSQGVWNGMRWGEINIRVVYKPSSSEVMCISEPCRSSDGSRRYTTALAFWDASYPTGSSASDIGFITRLTGGDFGTEPSDWNGPSPRALNTGDFMRIVDANMGSGYARIRGYGAHTDTDWDANPREGTIPVEHYADEIRARVSHIFATSCEADSGGPLLYNNDLGLLSGLNYEYAAGVTSRSVDYTPACPEHGDPVYYGRLASRRGMIDHILGWAGRGPCNAFTDSDLPGNHRYYRCW